MREILFRGKTTEGKWVQGSLQIGYGWRIIEGKRQIDHRICDLNNKCDNVIPETVGQYTGLTDKNGKKIFEGDICQTKGFPLIDDKPFVVEWNDDECSFYWRDALGTDEFNIGVSQNTTIIGNIHDNPELLKGGAE